MDQNEKLIICMVGLPARGKSYLCKKIARYLNWVGLRSKVFNIGMYRRTLVKETCDSNYFDQNNEEAVKEREKCAMEALNDLVSFISDGEGQVAILDATNTRAKRRRNVEEYLSKEMKEQYNLIWVESICTLENVIEQNILKTKVKNQDYIGWDPEKAVQDFRNRIAQYEKIYEPLSEELDGSESNFIKVINQNTSIVMRNLKGYITSKLVSYLINLHTGERPIYFTRHGQSEHNVKHLIGGDASLSAFGRSYAQKLSEFFKEEKKTFSIYPGRPKVFCSTLKRTMETASYLSDISDYISIKALDEINVGICDGMTYEEVKQKYPIDFEERSIDKLKYRYPRGESYMDMILRIEQVIFELERHGGPIIVVGHQGILRCLYGYFALAPIDDIPNLDIPLHTLIRFVPEAYGFTEDRFTMQDGVDGLVLNNNNIKRYKDNFIHSPVEKNES